MWHTSQNITAVYATHGSKGVYAIFSGLSGWTRLAQTSNDGVNNVGALISGAKAFGKAVNVYVDSSGTVTRALVL